MDRVHKYDIMDPEKSRKARVAVVGSGMAGLVAAYLLQRDPKRRYSVVLFESVG
jgi:glycine/D-amino acid oxidase-like deaminating enzyme